MSQLHDLKTLIWGTKPVEPDVFKRWSQGFRWSADQPKALVQDFGGPCSIIAPVQAFFLRNLLFAENKSNNLPLNIRDPQVAISEEEKQKVFVSALVQILKQCSNSSWCVAYLDPSTNSDGSSTTSPTFSYLHESLKVLRCDTIAELEEKLLQKYDSLFEPTGVLLFLYSAVLSRGVELVRSEHNNPDSMIDPLHGHGEQSMLNLILTGKAVPNVFDGDQDFSGLILQGISGPCEIGFLSYMETLRYIKVGDKLKRPNYPLWVVGSESHFSVVFTLEGRTCAPPSRRKHAEDVFEKHAEEGGSFILADKLQLVLQELDLESSEVYVDIMKKSLDPDEMGIILSSVFFLEFYPDEEKPQMPSIFEVYFYNGLVQSSKDHQVKFRKGTAQIIDWQDTSQVLIAGGGTDSHLGDCLQMRFPGLHISWDDGSAPSIN